MGDSLMNYVYNSPQYLFRADIQPNLSEDLNGIDQNSEELFIHGKTKGIDLLASFSRLTKLWVHSVNQKEFNQILGQVNPKMLYVYEMRVEDLSLLSNLSNLQTLGLEWNTRATRLWNLSKNTNLKALTIKGFSKLIEVQILAQAQEIELLEFEGDESNALKLDNLEPLKHLHHLVYLGLSNIKVLDDSLWPISELRGLKELVISNQFPTEEFAKLSVALPDTKCDKFSAFVRLPPLADGSDIMVIGKRKPFLNSKKDSSRMKKYKDRFRVLQETFKKEV